MPVKNAGSAISGHENAWLIDCLKSIQGQSFSRWELIAVDDHSSDNSKEILSTLAHKDNRIQIYNNEGNGIISALQMALKHSTGTFITRMDADDIMPADKLKCMLEVLEANPRAVVTGKVKYFADGLVSEGYLAYEKWLNERIDANDYWDWMYRECVIASANWMTHRDHVVLASDVYPEDYNLVFHWYENRLEVMGVDAVTHLWREHDKRTSRISAHYDQTAFFDLKLAQFLRFDQQEDRPLAVMGKNKKAKLIGQFLNKNQIAYIGIDLENLHLVAELDQPQVLVAVFPDELVREGIVGFLGGFGLDMGKDWWWV